MTFHHFPCHFLDKGRKDPEKGSEAETFILFTTVFPSIFNIDNVDPSLRICTSKGSISVSLLCLKSVAVSCIKLPSQTVSVGVIIVNDDDTIPCISAPLR